MPSSSDPLIALKVKGSSETAIILLFHILQIEELAFTEVRYLYETVTMHHVNILY
jgi:hypothetical protein